MRKLPVLLAILALAPLALAACGDDDDTTAETTATTEATGTTGGGGASGGETVDVTAAADGSLAYDEKSLSADAGSVTFAFDNPASIAHDFCIEQDGSDVGCTEVITDDSDTLEADLEPGEYAFYCSVAGHRAAGMEGTLTVK